jgi:hypothetical protein
MSPRRRGRGRGNSGGGGGAAGAAATGSHGRGPAAGADLAAAPSPSAAEIGPLAQEAVTAVDGSTLAAASTNTTARPSNGFASNGGPGPGPGPGGNASRGADSRRPPKTNTPSVIAASVIAASPQDAGVLDQPAGQRTSSCTLAQMRRFIKSRPYVPVHELRRRFLIEGIEDEVSPVSTGQRTLYVGLPAREAQFLGDLIRSGEVGCEMLLDPAGPGVVGVYPMRPVARQ